MRPLLLTDHHPHHLLHHPHHHPNPKPNRNHPYNPCAPEPAVLTSSFPLCPVLPPPCVPAGLTSCQLQRHRAQLGAAGAAGPQCQASGEFQPVQCSPARGQCWCVDLDGMELYGTRQDGPLSLCQFTSSPWTHPDWRVRVELLDSQTKTQTWT